jgi:hypothetical protein
MSPVRHLVPVANTWLQPRAEAVSTVGRPHYEIVRLRNARLQICQGAVFWVVGQA